MRSAPTYVPMRFRDMNSLSIFPPGLAHYWPRQSVSAFTSQQNHYSTKHRFVLASTTELHEKISELSQRVRQLEDGLRESHAKTSTEGHPLLADDLLKVKMPLQREPPSHRNGGMGIKEEENPPEALDAFGSLSISLSGRTKYFGHIANSWVSASADMETGCSI